MVESSASFQTWSGPKAWLWVRSQLLAGEDWAGWLQSGAEKLAQKAKKSNRVLGMGRGEAKAVELGGRISGVWRINRHGGVLGTLRGECFTSPKRLQHEVELSERLRAQGVCTPRVLLAFAQKSGCGWRQHLVTEEVGNAVTLFSARGEAAAMIAATALLKQVFGLGLWATDLHPGNLLWRAEDESCWLLDLAGAKCLRKPLNAKQRSLRVERFLRYYQKHAGEVPVAARQLREQLLAG